MNRKLRAQILASFGFVEVHKSKAGAPRWPEIEGAGPDHSCRYCDLRNAAGCAVRLNPLRAEVVKAMQNYGGWLCVDREEGHCFVKIKRGLELPEET